MIQAILFTVITIALQASMWNMPVSMTRGVLIIVILSSLWWGFILGKTDK